MMYHLATKDMTPAQRAAWWKRQAEDAYHNTSSHLTRDEDIYVAGKCKTATGFTADKRLTTHRGDEWYRQSSVHFSTWRLT
jgi:hypothetical protein